MLPPLLATIGKGMARKLSIAGLLRTLRETRDVRAYLSRAAPDETPVECEAHLRGMYDTLISRLDLDVPPEAIQPVVDHLVERVLAEFVSRSLQRQGECRDDGSG